jgi:hypothetical protein
LERELDPDHRVDAGTQDRVGVDRVADSDHLSERVQPVDLGDALGHVPGSGSQGDKGLLAVAPPVPKIGHLVDLRGTVAFREVAERGHKQ